MTLYSYRATDPSGRVCNGQIEALHEFDLQAQLHHQGLLLLRARASRTKQRLLRRMARRELISFLFQFEMLIHAGVPILSALIDLRESAESTATRSLAAGLHEKIEAGASVAEATAAYADIFSETLINLIRTGEVSGQLPSVLREIVRTMKWQDELVAQAKQALYYPGFVLVVVTLVVFFLMLYLVPQLVHFLTQMGRDIPLQTRLLIGLSDIFLRYGWALLLVPPTFVIGISASALASPTLRYKLDKMTLRLPLLGTVLKKVILARFADTLALMYRTGIPLVDALGYCQHISSNRVLRHSVQRARDHVLNGHQLSDSFAREMLFPPLVIRMLRVGESTGALDTALNNVSYFFSRDVDESVSKIRALIEPVLTLLLGLLLGWIMLAILGPVYDTISTLKM